MKPVGGGGGGSGIWASIITGISELWSRVASWWQGPTVPLAKDRTTPESQEVTKDIYERTVKSDTTTATHNLIKKLTKINIYNKLDYSIIY